MMANTRYPAIPAPRPGDLASLAATVFALKRVVEMLTGVGNSSDATKFASTKALDDAIQNLDTGLTSPEVLSRVMMSTPGPRGRPGADGIGLQGPPGADGEDGERGPPGVRGLAGDTGMRGPPGYDGEDGDIGGYGNVAGLQGILGYNVLYYAKGSLIFGAATPGTYFGAQATFEVVNPLSYCMLNFDCPSGYSSNLSFSQGGVGKWLLSSRGDAGAGTPTDSLIYYDKNINPCITMLLDNRVYIGNSPNSNVSSSMLELSSTTLGFLPPRMTTTQRDNIVSPVAGLVVYNTTTGVLNFYNGATWGAV